MNKKFLFVNLSIECGYNSGINHGMACLVPIVKKHSYDVACYNLRNEISPTKFRKTVEMFNPSIVAFSATSQQLKYLEKYSKELEKMDILQIVGGAGPTLDPQSFLSQSLVKGACIGEGEIPLGSLLSKIRNRQNIFDTEGFCWKIEGEFKRNFVTNFISDLSLLDFPDYTVFERSSVVNKGDFAITISRGCPYNCYYCCNKALSDVYNSKNFFRLPSVEHSLMLLESIIKQYPEIEFISFEDDLLIANEAWFNDFADEYRRRINLPYRVCVRVECITPNIVKALKDSGCKWVFLGLESGNEHLRKVVLNRRYSNQLLIEKCEMIKNANLNLFTFNIVGFPFETRKEFEDTFELNRRIAPNSGVCTFFYPYRNTALYNICKKENLLRIDKEMMEITNYNTRPSIKMSKSLEKECIYFQKKILNYLLKQKFLTEIAQFPSGIRGYILTFIYFLKLFLPKIPLLYKPALFFVSLLKRLGWRIKYR